MRTTRQAEREARRLFRFCIVSGKVDEKRVRLVTQAAFQSRHRGYLLVLGRFQRLLREEYARHTAEIESAMPLPADLGSRVQTGLTAVYGIGLRWLYIDNPALIGGMRIKVGSDVYDSSVRTGLALLARSFGIPDTSGRHEAN